MNTKKKSKDESKTESETNTGSIKDKELLTAEELTDLLKRTQANFENYRKQMQGYIEDIKKMAAKDLIMQLLPVIDNFELALKTINQGQMANDFVQGMELIYSQLVKILHDNEVIQIETKGKNFDPHNHEALMKVNSDFAKNKIIEEFQKGFMMHGKVLRHAKVKVSAGLIEKEEVVGETENKKENQDTKNENLKMKTAGGN